jgi:hypothetical protein
MSYTSTGLNACNLTVQSNNPVYWQGANFAVGTTLYTSSAMPTHQGSSGHSSRAAQPRQLDYGKTTARAEQAAVN